MLDIQQVKDRVLAKVFSKSPWLFNEWVRQSTFAEFNDSPWNELTKPINECRLALITTGGVHLKSQVPFDMKDPAGDPTFRDIPADTRPSDLSITHNYYDHSDAEKDINIVLPIERVRTLESSGEIGDVNHRHFSFMGHIKDFHLPTLVTETAPGVADMLKADEVDIAILTPAWGICNQSVGLIQRAVEKAGITTISVSLAKDITKKILPPRAVFPGFPLGHPIGFPGNENQQLWMLRILLKYLQEIDSPGSLVELDPTSWNDPVNI